MMSLSIPGMCGNRRKRRESRGGVAERIDTICASFSGDGASGKLPITRDLLSQKFSLISV